MKTLNRLAARLPHTTAMYADGVINVAITAGVCSYFGLPFFVLALASAGAWAFTVYMYGRLYND